MSPVASVQKNQKCFGSPPSSPGATRLLRPAWGFPLRCGSAGPHEPQVTLGTHRHPWSPSAHDMGVTTGPVSHSSVCVWGGGPRSHSCLLAAGGTRYPAPLPCARPGQDHGPNRATPPPGAGLPQNPARAAGWAAGIHPSPLPKAAEPRVSCHSAFCPADHCEKSRPGDRNT